MKKIPDIKKPLWQRVFYGGLLSIPLIISIGTIISITTRNTAPVLTATGLLFSPVRDSGALITGLVIFTLGYLVFIGFLFSHNIKEFFAHKTHR